VEFIKNFTKKNCHARREYKCDPQRTATWVKRGRCFGLTTLSPSRADPLEILGASASRSPVKACTGIDYLCFIFSVGG